MSVQSRTFVIDGGSLAGLEARPDDGEVRGTVLALPGGGYRAGYWDSYGGDADGSLLRLGARLGRRVVAVDRPGYGDSMTPPRGRGAVAWQAELLAGLVRELGAEDGSVGVTLVGHSLGAITALQIAADHPGLPLAGVSVSGLPVEYPEYMRVGMAAHPLDGAHLPAHPAEAVRMMFYGPDGSFDPEALERDLRNQAPVPVEEFVDARDYPTAFPSIAPRVRVPVQYVLAAHEASSCAGPEVLARAAASFAAAPWVEAFEQAASGHDISLHRVARAYHLRVLAFDDECRVRCAATVHATGSTNGRTSPAARENVGSRYH
ncbi:alpha/beta fold hydrolase [Pseudonocardia sp. NPDC049154]|uniref:alpha/beta fold hydrolase n=1 Tax=Pseudonocardia sp. NPDC049154 TaxID=3155501 RepID=UPI0033CEB957